MDYIGKNNVIKIMAGQEHTLLDSQDITDQESLMYPAFCAALDALDGIVRATDAWTRENRAKETQDETWTEEARDGGASQSIGFYGYSNNILAFCAPRGQGKTSAMLSFSKAVTHRRPSPSRLERGEGRRGAKKLDAVTKGRWFYSLPPIDPTMLNEGESVIQLVLGRLFHEISTKWEAGPIPSRRREEENLDAVKMWTLEDFKTCCHGLHRINRQSGQDRDLDEFEEMLTANDVFKLKECIHHIIRYYFRLSGSDPDRSFLFIQLDDTDMQMRHAYSILEEVRKYLAMPNVIVLMATHLDQLRTLIVQQYAAQLKSAYPEGSSGLKADTRHMAAKYLDKLIPASQTVYLPTMRLQRDTERELKLQIEYEDGGESVCQELENAMFAQIYEKTALAFIRHDNYMHNLLPQTLRGLQHLFRLLDRMELPPKPGITDLPGGSEGRDARREYYQKLEYHLRGKYRNLLLFESYFMNDWCSSKIVAEDWNYLRDVDKTASIRRFSYTAHLFQKRRQQNGNELPFEDFAIEKKDFIRLVLLLGQEATQCVTEDDYLFVTAMETYFSIQMNKLALTDEIESAGAKLQQIELGETDAPLPLYRFPQLSRHIRACMGTPSKAQGGEKTDSFIHGYESLVRSCTRNSSQTEQRTKTILSWLMRLLCLDGTQEQNPRALEYFTALQEYAVYICCNLDVLSQIFKKSENFSSFTGERKYHYLYQLRGEIVTKKKTLAHPFPSQDTSYSLAGILEFFTPKDPDEVNAALLTAESTVAPPDA